MDNIVVIKGLVFLLGILFLTFVISYFIYYLFKRKRKQKAGKMVSFSVLSILIVSLVYVLFGFPFFAFEQYCFLKSEATDDLKGADIFLIDDFQVLENKVDRFISYTHTFKLKISTKDVQHLLKDENSDEKTIVVRFSETNTTVSTKVLKVIIDAETNILTYSYLVD